MGRGGQQGAAHRRQDEQRGGLAGCDALEGWDVQVDAPTTLQLLDLAEHQVVESGGGHQVEAVNADAAHQRQGTDEQQVARNDADGISPGAARSGATAAHHGIVDDVVVQERGGVEHFHGGGDEQGVGGRGAVGDGPACGDEHHGRAEAFSASGDEVGRGASAGGVSGEAGGQQLVDAIEVGAEQGGEVCQAGAHLIGAVIAGGNGSDLREAGFVEEGSGLHSLVS